MITKILLIVLTFLAVVLYGELKMKNETDSVSVGYKFMNGKAEKINEFSKHINEEKDLHLESLRDNKKFSCVSGNYILSASGIRKNQ